MWETDDDGRYVLAAGGLPLIVGRPTNSSCCLEILAERFWSETVQVRPINSYIWYICVFWRLRELNCFLGWGWQDYSVVLVMAAECWCNRIGPRFHWESSSVQRKMKPGHWLAIGAVCLFPWSDTDGWWRERWKMYILNIHEYQQFLFAAQHYAGPAFAVVVCLSVCREPVLYPNDWMNWAGFGMVAFFHLYSTLCFKERLMFC